MKTCPGAPPPRAHQACGTSLPWPPTVSPGLLCFPAASPRVRFNSLATEWERSEQAGIATLMKGLFSTFRNPAAHAPRVAWATSRSDALDMLTLASMLHRRLDEADVR